MPAMNIFAYGTLMLPSVMYAVTAREFQCKDAIIRGYARFTVKGELYPGIIPKTDAITEGIVYLDVDELSIERLDAFEGDLYRRTPIQAESEKEELFNAEAYVVIPKYRGCLSSKQWNVKNFVQKHLKAFLETYQGFQ
jgi:gamma-glutamylcyclotransferase (GGCT)/AIG2-like uncharacterized protein YtfP